MGCKPDTCFGYDSKQIYTATMDGKVVAVRQEYCRPLTVMQCRKKTNAKKACRFYKTPGQYEAGIKKYGGLKQAERKRK